MCTYVLSNMYIIYCYNNEMINLFKSHEVVITMITEDSDASHVHFTECYSVSVNPLAAGAAYIRVFIFYYHIKYNF